MIRTPPSHALGAATALMGEKAAMACTVAVEDVIDEHYARQIERLLTGHRFTQVEQRVDVPLTERDIEMALRDKAQHAGL